MDTILDLDQLAPQPKKVKLGGKIIEVHPPRLKHFIELQKFFISFDGLESKEQLDQLDRLESVLKPIVPDIESVDLTLEQLMKLLEYALSQPQAPGPQEAKKGGEQAS